MWALDGPCLKPPNHKEIKPNRVPENPKLLTSLIPNQNKTEGYLGEINRRLNVLFDIPDQVTNRNMLDGKIAFFSKCSFFSVFIWKSACQSDIIVTWIE